MVRALLSVLLLAVSLAAWSQSYPSRPVRIVVPYAVGGPADIYARFIAARLQDNLGQPVIVEDRPGAGSIVGTDHVAKSAPDGYTLLMMSNTHTVNETLIPQRPFELMRDFAPITGVNYSDLLLVIHPSVAATTLKEFIALAKAKPGSLNYASSGNGTPYHMAGELFKAMAGVDIVHVPYRGGAPAVQDVMGGRVPLLMDTYFASEPFIKSGKLKPIALFSPQRPASVPDIPVVAETVPGVFAQSSVGVVGPAGIPAAVLRKISADIMQAVRSPDEVLADVDLSDAADQRVETFSKGMKMRLNLARSLLHDPELLFLDEPTTGQDPNRSRMTRDLILKLKARGKTIFLTTHNMAEAEEICDRVGFLVGGRIPVTGTPTGNQIAIGSTLADTIRNAVVALNASSDGNVTPASYSADLNLTNIQVTVLNSTQFSYFSFGAAEGSIIATIMTHHMAKISMA